MQMHVLDFADGAEETAQLLFKTDVLERFTPLKPTVIDITSRFAPERARVEQFIREIYRKSYGADIAVTYPVLMSVRNQDGDILAAAGFRPAASEPLFLEQYTGEEIESVLSKLIHKPIPRSEIAEIGNLASAGKGASVFLFAAIASYLLNHNINFATVTGTDQLHKRFRLMGLDPHVICDASVEKLKTEQKNWGTYYDTQPRVLAGSLESSMLQLNRKLGAVYQENGITLFPRLHHRGNSGFWRFP